MKHHLVEINFYTEKKMLEKNAFLRKKIAASYTINFYDLDENIAFHAFFLLNII